MSCDCGEADKPQHSKAKCIHLREAEEKAKADPHGELSVDSPEKDTAHLAAVAEEQGCCCHHGGKCTCCLLKKEVITEDDVGLTPPHRPAVKPRLESQKSEGSITVFQNGHHKPVHRKNHLAHESGNPYKLPMARAHTDQNVSTQARRSVDSLALNHNASLGLALLTPRPDALCNLNRRMSKSEQHSPKMTSSDAFGNRELNPIDFSNLGPFELNQGTQSANSANPQIAPLDPMSSMTDHTFDPWSNLPSSGSMTLPNNNPFGVWPSTNDFTGGLAQPALTAASSNTQSESDELPLADDMYGFGMPSIQEDNTGGYPLIGGPSSNHPQAYRRSLPPSFFSAYDVTAPNTFDNWQPNALDTQYSTTATFPKSNVNTQLATAYDDTWQPGIYASPTDGSARQPTGLVNLGRPSSQAVGALSNSASDDVLLQLFPNVDPNGGFFEPLDGARGFSNGSNNDSGMHFANTMSAPMNYDPTAFTSQAWTRSSMSVANDPLTSSYNMNQDFSDTDYTGNWSQ